MSLARESDRVPWSKRPAGFGVGVRPTELGVDLMIGVPGQSTEFYAMRIEQARAVRQALDQAIDDHVRGVIPR